MWQSLGGRQVFGYIKPFKPELKICEFEAYKAVYCGLCGQMGASFGPLARAALSYDFTFLSMLHMALSSDIPGVRQGRCHVNPLKKTPCAEESESLRLGADMAAIMLYYKLLDNIEDSGFWGKIVWSLPRPFVAAARKKAAKKRPEGDRLIAHSMARQAEVEAANSNSLDAASEPTAEAMSGLFAMLSHDEKQRRILERFGYLLGRYVYLCDALDDLESDLKSGGYNPLVLRYNLTLPDTQALNTARQTARESLYMTIGEAARAFDFLELSCFQPVLENIVALGLRASVDEIIKKPNPKKPSPGDAS